MHLLSVLSLIQHFLFVNLLVEAFLIVLCSRRTFSFDAVEKLLGCGHLITLFNRIESFLDLELDRVMAPPKRMIYLAIFHLPYWGLFRA